MHKQSGSSSVVSYNNTLIPRMPLSQSNPKFGVNLIELKSIKFVVDFLAKQLALKCWHDQLLLLQYIFHAL